MRRRFALIEDCLAHEPMCASNYHETEEFCDCGLRQARKDLAQVKEALVMMVYLWSRDSQAPDAKNWLKTMDMLSRAPVFDDKDRERWARHVVMNRDDRP